MINLTPKERWLLIELLTAHVKGRFVGDPSKHYIADALTLLRRLEEEHAAEAARDDEAHNTRNE